MLDMSFGIWASNGNVIDIDKDIVEVFEDLSVEALDKGGHIGNAKGTAFPLVLGTVPGKSEFVAMFRFDKILMEAFTYIEFGEFRAVSEFVEGVENLINGKFVISLHFGVDLARIKTNAVFDHAIG
eukprot:Nk52_evm1s1558 gene=Nk52_evmTU1s1558